MKFGDIVLTALRYVKSRMPESILVIIGTALGVGITAAVITFIQVYRSNTDELLNHPQYRELIVRGTNDEGAEELPLKVIGTDSADAVRFSTEDADNAVSDAPSVSYGYFADPIRHETGETRVMSFVRGMAADRFRDQQGMRENPEIDQERIREFFQNQEEPDEIEPALDSFPGLMVSEDYFEAYSLVPQEGTTFTGTDIEQGNRVVVLGHELSKRLYPDGNAAGRTLRINGLTYTVIGILKKVDYKQTDPGKDINNLAFTPQISGMFRFAALQRGKQEIHFSVEHTDDLVRAKEQLLSFFEGKYGSGSISVTAPIETVLDSRSKYVNLLTIILFLSGAAFFIAMVNIFNLMITRVLKRTKDIGIFRALGGSKKNIFRMFITESLILTAAGSAAGALIAPLLYRILGSRVIPSFESLTGISSINWGVMILAVIAAFIINSFSGAVPASQASNINVSDSIRMD